MVITAVLSAVVLWCLLYTVVPIELLYIICIGISLIIAFGSRHKHGSFLTIDQMVMHSHLYSVNPTLKTIVSIILLTISISTKSCWIGLILFMLMMVITVGVGKIKLADYGALMALPVSFLLLSGLALLLNYFPNPDGVLNIRFFHGWISVTANAQAQASLVMAKALGALSCLYFLSLSTPMTDIIGVLRRAHVPAIVIELMYLIYRYIFILFEMYFSMHNAATSRLGYINYRISVRTTGRIYANLLARSFRKANACFDAMESRCYDGEINFLETAKQFKLCHCFALASLVMFVSVLSVSLSL